MVEPGFYLGDCMDFLKDMPDKSIDLAICDPPYGINVGKASMGMGGAKLHTETDLRAGRRKQAIYPIRRQAQPEMGGGENRRGKALRKESESGASNYQPQNL